jgi:hypothetical protein
MLRAAAETALPWIVFFVPLGDGSLGLIPTQVKLSAHRTGEPAKITFLLQLSMIFLARN